MLELGLRVQGAPIKRLFDLYSFAKGPDGSSRTNHFDFSTFARGPDRPPGAPRKRYFVLSRFAKSTDGLSGARG